MSTEDLAATIKRAALEAVNTQDPCTFLFGTVRNASPLTIQIESDNKLVLDAGFLILTRNVVDYAVDMTVNCETGKEAHMHEYDNAGSICVTEKSSHSHAVSGKFSYNVHNALKAGDKVILIKQQGGQKYLVLDKVNG